MALRSREQAASPKCLVSPAVGEHAILRTVPALEYRIAELEAENAVLRTLAYGDLPQDPGGTTDAKGGW